MTSLERKPVLLDRVDSLSPDIENMYNQVATKAYEYFVERGCINGHDVDDWLRAEHALLLKPQVQLRREGNAFVTEVSLPDADPRELHIRLATGEMLIGSEPRDGRQVFRIVRFPEPIDFAIVDADFSDGILRVITAIAVESQAGSHSAVA